MSTPRVWLGCLGCYGNGYLVGEWFNAGEAPTDVETFNRSDIWFGNAGPVPIEHVSEQHEELWVFDHENFYGLLTDECSPIAARDLAKVLQRQGVNAEAFAAFVRTVYGNAPTADDLTTAEHEFADAYCGEYDSERDYAMDLAEQIDALPHEHSWPASYINWEAATRDLFVDHYSAATGHGTVYVFRSL